MSPIHHVKIELLFNSLEKSVDGVKHTYQVSAKIMATAKTHRVIFSGIPLLASKMYLTRGCKICSRNKFYQNKILKLYIDRVWLKPI